MAGYRSILRRLGLELRRFPQRDYELTLKTLIDQRGIELVVDVGANTGQFCQSLRAVEHHGDMVSFEPMQVAYAALEINSGDDARWQVRKLALGGTAGELEINIAANSYSSSLLPMEQAHLDAAPESAIVGTETVKVSTLDREFASETRKSLLKIDTQGYEGEVLDGLGAFESCVDAIAIELSFVELYSGQPLYAQMFERLTAMGFEPWWIQPEFIDPTTRRMLQVNGVFVRTGSSP